MFFKPMLPRNAEPRMGLSIGEHCELMAKRWKISREAQESHIKLASAYERGFFNDLMTPDSRATTTCDPMSRSISSRN